MCCRRIRTDVRASVRQRYAVNKPRYRLAGHSAAETEMSAKCHKRTCVLSVTSLFALDEYCKARQCHLKTISRSKTIPLSGVLPCEGRPPMRRAWVADFELLWRGTSILETSLWLAAQRDHKFCAVARLRAKRFV